MQFSGLFVQNKLAYVDNSQICPCQTNLELADGRDMIFRIVIFMNLDQITTQDSQVVTTNIVIWILLILMIEDKSWGDGCIILVHCGIEALDCYHV